MRERVPPVRKVFKSPLETRRNSERNSVLRPDGSLTPRPPRADPNRRRVDPNRRGSRAPRAFGLRVDHPRGAHVEHGPNLEDEVPAECRHWFHSRTHARHGNEGVDGDDIGENKEDDLEVIHHDARRRRQHGGPALANTHEHHDDSKGPDAHVGLDDVGELRVVLVSVVSESQRVKTHQCHDALHPEDNLQNLLRL